MGRHCFNDWMNCGILISKINIAWILCLHDLCFIRITYDNKIMYEQFSVWSLIKNVIWTYSLWAIYILRLCPQTCTPNRHALQFWAGSIICHQDTVIIAFDVVVRAPGDVITSSVVGWEAPVVSLPPYKEWAGFKWLLQECSARPLCSVLLRGSS